MNFNQTNNPILTSDEKLQNNFNSQSVLPRRAWQDRQAFVRAIVKTKRVLDIVEIEHLVD